MESVILLMGLSGTVATGDVSAGPMPSCAAADLRFKLKINGVELKSGMTFLQVLNAIKKQPDRLSFDNTTFTAVYWSLEAAFTMHQFVFAADGRLEHIAIISD